MSPLEIFRLSTEDRRYRSISMFEKRHIHALTASCIYGACKLDLSFLALVNACKDLTLVKF
jgi:hypothetical protein